MRIVLAVCQPHDMNKLATSQRALVTFGGPLGIVGIMIALLSVMAFYGEWWWLLDIAANFRPQLLVMGLGVLLGGAALRARGVAAIGLVVVALNLGPILPLYWGAGATATDSELRIASYNLLQSATEDRGEVIEWLRTVDADVVFLQEASLRWARFIRRADLGWTVIDPRPRDYESFGTLALVPVDADVTFVDVLYRRSPAVTLEVDGEAVTVLGIHALSPYGRAQSEIRDTEFLELADWVNGLGNLVIVAGDFNASPFSWSFRRLLQVSDMQNSLDGFGLQPTWPTTNVFLRIPIDHLLYTDGFEVVDRQVLGSFGSDHFPIVVDLALRG